MVRCCCRPHIGGRCEAHYFFQIPSRVLRRAIPIAMPIQSECTLCCTYISPRRRHALRVVGTSLTSNEFHWPIVRSERNNTIDNRLTRSHPRKKIRLCRTHPSGTNIDPTNVHTPVHSCISSHSSTRRRDCHEKNERTRIAELGPPPQTPSQAPAVNIAQ